MCIKNEELCIKNEIMFKLKMMSFADGEEAARRPGQFSMEES